MQITDLKSIDNNAEALFAISAHEPVLLKRQGDNAARVVVDYEVFKRLQDLLSVMMPNQEKNLSQSVADVFRNLSGSEQMDFDVDFDGIRKNAPIVNLDEFQHLYDE